VSDERVADLVRRAWDGEVLGEALFSRLLELRSSDAPAQSARLRSARDLEAQTLVCATTLAADLGVDVGDGATARADGVRVADAIAPLPWDDLVAAVVSGTGVYRDLYASLASVCDHPAVGELVAHEPALHEVLRG
jgi:hypothetical protein